MADNFKETLNLPRTSFPMRAGLTSREPERWAHWEKLGLYQRIQDARAESETFILHDGPPFTNGDVHIGTALNKILKDIIVRFETMRGKRTPYIPGWDCHGLPIEHKVARQMQEEGRTATDLEMREACAAYSRAFIEKQRGQFQRLGILADWENEYRTMDPAYEAEILRVFAAIVESGRVYRSKKPVYWSIPCKTALAEAEIEYRDHVSVSIHVRFPLETPETLGLPAGAGVLIWTTTPWTIPANMAIALHPELTYVALKSGDDVVIVAEALAEQVASDLGWENLETVGRWTGRELEGTRCRHPLIERESPIVVADYVTTESGTGAVHTAPGHGMDDYLTGLKYGLEVYSPLDDDGRYLDDGRIPTSLVGLGTLETDGLSEANRGVLKLLAESGHLLRKQKYPHSYPHCWRSKTPIVFRSLDQWFASLDEGGARQKVLQAIDNVGWDPEWAERRFRAAVENRPDWVISRQRSWGVPIPAIVDAKTGEALLDGGFIRHLAQRVATEGTDAWFREDLATLLEGYELPAEWQGRELAKGRDTLDVWIDSGCSHAAVLAKRENLSWPADVYLEGTDQHRGWFQSSMWTSMLTKEAPPYRSVITHGFIVDENREKISKSGDKPMTADSFVGKYGADIVRLWISSQDFRNDIPISDEAFGHISQTYRTIRNTLRFQISNLFDFDAAKDWLPIKQRREIDQWAVNQMADLVEVVTGYYESRQFHLAYQELNRFCAVTLSATYHDVIKDRLYTFAPNSESRRSVQSSIHDIAIALRRVLAPILLFTSDEAEAYAISDGDFREDSIHLESWPEAASLRPPAPEANAWAEAALAIRPLVTESLEQLRKEKVIGQSLEGHLELGLPVGHPLRSLEGTQLTERLAEMYIISQVTVTETAGDDITVKTKKAEGVRCPRCWRIVTELQSVSPDQPEVCSRCAEALASVATTETLSS